jgi:hypothetical protein
MNTSQPQAQQLLEIARTPTVERIEIEGTYHDPQTRQVMPLRQTIGIRHIPRENISFPEDLQVTRIAVLGDIRPDPGKTVPSIPNELDRQRQEAGLPPLPFRWVCESTEPIPGGIAYKCVAGT